MTLKRKLSLGLILFSCCISGIRMLLYTWRAAERRLYQSWFYVNSRGRMQIGPGIQQKLIRSDRVLNLIVLLLFLRGTKPRTRTRFIETENL